jgi:hypothetical protein
MSGRSPHVRSLPCLACQIEGLAIQCGRTEEHHLNLGGLAGQKRRGNEYSIPLGAWHHRGVPPEGMTADMASRTYGPSLARSSKLFRFTYGSDDQLLALTNLKLQAVA